MHVWMVKLLPKAGGPSVFACGYNPAGAWVLLAVATPPLALGACRKPAGAWVSIAVATHTHAVGADPAGLVHVFFSVAGLVDCFPPHGFFGAFTWGSDGCFCVVPHGTQFPLHSGRLWC